MELYGGGQKMEQLNTEIEEWRDIKGYEGLYQVSNLGRVKSLERWTKRRDCKCWKKEHIMSGSNDGRGYRRVNLYNNGISEKFRVHQLVANAFLPKPDGCQYINHKDLNKANNRASNLEWCTQKHNMRDASNKGVFDDLKHPIKDIETGTIYSSIRECALALNLEPKNLSAHLNGKRNSCGGYRFERVD